MDTDARKTGEVPSESPANKPIPLPIIGVVNSDVRIGGQRRIICVETFNIVYATEFCVAYRQRQRAHQDIVV